MAQMSLVSTRAAIIAARRSVIAVTPGWAWVAADEAEARRAACIRTAEAALGAALAFIALADTEAGSSAAIETESAAATWIAEMIECGREIDAPPMSETARTMAARLPVDQLIDE